MKTYTIVILSVILLIVLWMRNIYIKYTFEMNELKCMNRCMNKKLMSQEKYNSKKIAIVTLETRESEMLNIHNKNVNEYCKLHNYTYIFRSSYQNKLNLPIYWKKLQLIKDVLETKKYEYVVWMDSDTLFIDKSIPLDMILGESSIYMGKDRNTDFNLNAGVFCIKNNKIGLTFLRECINVYLNREKCKDEKGNYALNGEWSKDCYEQGVMNELIVEKYLEHFSLFDEYMVLNTNAPNTKCFILHLFGGTEKYKDEKRNMAFRYILDNNNYFDKRINQMFFYINYFLKTTVN